MTHSVKICSDPALRRPGSPGGCHHFPQPLLQVTSGLRHCQTLRQATTTLAPVHICRGWALKDLVVLDPGDRQVTSPSWPTLSSRLYSSMIEVLSLRDTGCCPLPRP